ncbi:MAG: hypothetical protein L0H59_12095 [Tomitella sp.]|nr:hypothetical protein [Tomitella sp.]
MTHNPPHRAAGQGPEDTPVLLPHVVITVTETGVLDVTVDGTVFPPPSQGQAWTRGTFGTLLDAITADRTTTVRIEVRETDGSVFTDIIRGRRRPTPEIPETEPGNPRGKHAKNKGTQGPVLAEITADRFVPGEDVAIAVIVSHTDATGTGSARTLLNTSQLASLLRTGTGEVVLFGRVSGTMHVRRLP